MERRNNCRQSMGVFSDLSNMKRLVFVLLLIASFGESDASIRCVCSDCASGECSGDICYSQVSIGHEPGADPVYRHRCFFQSQVQSCNRSSDWHTTLCCESEFCNAYLQPLLQSSGDSSTSSADYISPTDLFSTTESEGSSSGPTRSVTTTAFPPPPPLPPTVSSSLSCYVSDSTIGLEVGLCTLEAYCFSTLRRRTDGSVTYKRGCSKTCVNETRNRKIKRCCSHSLCNAPISDPFKENGSGATTRLIADTTLPSQPSPPPAPITTASPIVTYDPPSLRPRPLTPTMPTSAPSTASPATVQPHLTCYCDVCGDATICMTSEACATLFIYGVSEGGAVPDEEPSRSFVTTKNFCLSNVVGCNETLNPLERLSCCNDSYCNNLEISSTFEPRHTTTEALPTSEVSESTSDLSTTTPTSMTAPTRQVSVESPDLDLPFIIGLCVLIIAGITLVIVVIGLICCFCISKQKTKSSSGQKAKTMVAGSCSPAILTVVGEVSTAAANAEPDVEASTSTPSPNIYMKQRESVSVGSSGSGSEEVHRTSYSSTSV